MKDMTLTLILLIFTLLLEVQPQRLSDQVWLTASPASVQKDSNTTQLRYERPTDADYSHNNTVFNPKEKPVITVTHDYQNGQFRINCQIPGSHNTGYACFIYIGEENLQILKSTKPPGGTQCISTLPEHLLFNNLKSVKSKVMSCSYSPEPSSSKHSPYSDKFNLTVFLPVQNQSPSTTKASTLYSTPTFSNRDSTPTFSTSDSTPIFSTSDSTPTFSTGETKTLTTEYTTWYETTINPTAAVEASHPGETDGHRIPKTWLIMALAATSGGISLTGLMGLCLFCTRQKPRKKSPMNTVATISQIPDEDDEDMEEHEEKLYHVYCTIPDDPVDTHILYSLAQMPNHSC